MEERKAVKVAVLELTKSRYPKSCCPSEIARTLFGEAWRMKMDLVTSVAVSLLRKGDILITQKEKPLIPIRKLRAQSD